MGLDMYLHKKERVGYWRKANAIHKWFVDNIQSGKDDCETYAVEYKDLLILKNICQKVLATKDPTLLPPSEGFYFGSQEADEYYFESLQETIDMIDNLDSESDYIYRASW